MTDQVVDSDRARRRLYEIMKSDAAFEEKAEEALKLGETYLGVDNGHVAEIDPEAGYWEAIASSDDADGDFPAGLVENLATTYCRRTIQAEESITLNEASAQGWADDPAYRTHGLECYHGTAIEVDGEPFGTLCFVSESSRKPFEEHETMFAELIARLFEHELEQEQHEAAMRQRSTLISVLSRVLRHNIRNDMTVIRGYLSFEVEATNGHNPLEPPLHLADEIITLSEKARRLDQLVNQDFNRESVDLRSLLDRLVSTVASNYPAATFAVKGPESLWVRALPSLEVAILELLENAAKHAGETPGVTVMIEEQADEVLLHVSDDGPGLPEMEIEVLSGGSETPLMHGSGLGLWLVHWAATSHDGTVDAEVTDGGTTVTISIAHGSSDPESIARATEGRLQRSYDRFQAIFDGAFDPLVILDNDGRCVEVNQAAAELFGHTENTMIGRSVRDCSEGYEELEEAWRAVQDTDRHRGELRITQPDGTRRDVEYAVTTDIIPGQHLCVFRDVTERKARDEALERSRAHLEAVYEHSPDMIDVLDPAGRIIDANGRLCEELGYDEDELIGMPIWEIDREVTRTDVEELLEEFNVGERRRFIGRYERVDGSTFPVEVHLRKLDIDGEDRFLAISREVTTEARPAQGIEP